MRIVVPHTNLRRGVIPAILNAGYNPIAADVRGSDDAYFKVLAGEWQMGWDFAIVEHDVIVTKEQLDALDACPGEWCTFPHLYLDNLPYHGLALARFRGSLTQRFPDIWDEVGSMSNDQHPRRHWCTCDAYLQVALARRRVEPCRHVGLLTHLGVGVSHGCRS